MIDSIEPTPRPLLSEHVYCPGCNYDLHLAPGDRCPECGYSLAALRSCESLIPWTHRRACGILRTFWQTVWLVTFRQRLFCCECAKKPSYADARRFQLVVILYVYVPVLMFTALWYGLNPPWAAWRHGSGLGTTVLTVYGAPSLLDIAANEVWPVVVLHVFIFSFLLAVTGVPSYFFHPQAASLKQQNNGIVLSYYTSAPLAASGPGIE